MEIKILLQPKDFKPSCRNWEIEGILNPGAIRLPNKKILLMARVAESFPKLKEQNLCPVIVTKQEYNKEKDKSIKGIIGKDKNYFVASACKLPTISHFRKIVLSKDGLKLEKKSQVQDFSPNPKTSEYGVEDPRITKLDDNYLMTYVSVSEESGVSVTLAISKDLKNWERRGIIFQEQNKDVVIFPEKINGKFVALNRPESNIISKSDIWISYSKDLIYWGREKNILRTREYSWEEARNGAGPPPIKTKKGWLVIYHGVRIVDNQSNYSAGAVLLDLKNPEKILARSPANKPLFSPENLFEKHGFMNNVTFPTGLIEDLNKKDVLIYGGGADTTVTVRKMSLDKIFKSMEYY